MNLLAKTHVRHCFTKPKWDVQFGFGPRSQDRYDNFIQEGRSYDRLVVGTSSTLSETFKDHRKGYM